MSLYCNILNRWRTCTGVPAGLFYYILQYFFLQISLKCFSGVLDFMDLVGPIGGPAFSSPAWVKHSAQAFSTSGHAYQDILTGKEVKLYVCLVSYWLWASGCHFIEWWNTSNICLRLSSFPPWFNINCFQNLIWFSKLVF